MRRLMATEFSFLCKSTVCHFCFTLFCFPLLSGNIQNLLLKIGAWVQSCSLVLLPKSQLPFRTLGNFVFFFLFLFFLSFIISFPSFSLSFFSWNSYELNVESPDSLNTHMLLSLFVIIYVHTKSRTSVSTKGFKSGSISICLWLNSWGHSVILIVT